DPHSLYQALNPNNNSPGIDALQELVHAGLAVTDDAGTLRPRLAEAVPSLENGLWQLLPDSRMTTTWKIKPGAVWQDGAPFTSADLAFTLTVMRDPEIPVFAEKAFDWIERVETPDPATVRLTWSQPYIEADTLFTYALGLPMPKHLL